MVRGKETTVSFGPDGCGEDPLRPTSERVSMPWDAPVRTHFGYDGSGRSYCRFLQTVQGWLNELSANCRKHGIEMSRLPEILNEPHASLVKLVDEYLWVTTSKKCRHPRNLNCSVGSSGHKLQGFRLRHMQWTRRNGHKYTKYLEAFAFPLSLTSGCRPPTMYPIERSPAVAMCAKQR